MKQTDRQLRRLEDLFNGQWGKLMEALVEGDLVKLLSQRGVKVDHTVSNLKSTNGARKVGLPAPTTIPDSLQRAGYADSST